MIIIISRIVIRILTCIALIIMIITLISMAIVMIIIQPLRAFRRTIHREEIRGEVL